MSKLKEIVKKNAEKRVEAVEKLAEEIELNTGFKVKTTYKPYNVIVETPIGILTRPCNNLNHMLEFYHFMSYYGSKTQQYYRDKIIKSNEPTTILKGGKITCQQCT